MPFFQQLPVRRAAVPLGGDAYVQVGVDIDPDPVFRPENVRHRDAVRIRNIVAAPDHHDPLSVPQKLLHDSAMRIVRIFKGRADLDVSEVEDPPL